MKIENLMSRDLIVSNINDSIYDIAVKMKQFDIGFMPIEQNKHILGVITDRDIIVRAVTNNVESDAKVEAYMTKNVFHMDVSDEINRCLELMGKEKVKRILITDKERVVGILSLSDFINHDIDEHCLIEQIKQVWEIKKNIQKEETEIDEFYL